MKEDGGGCARGGGLAAGSGMCKGWQATGVAGRGSIRGGDRRTDTVGGHAEVGPGHPETHRRPPTTLRRDGTGPPPPTPALALDGTSP